ncbi:MAG: TRAP transporter small permease [Rhodospirillales bacterium]|nr:TRAP transporter small permease [Rhodospirillales bacterium]MDC0989621.1 TRAP transporter small permease [Rhodospirillales bacterium]
MNDYILLARLREYSSRALIFFASLILFALMWLTVIDVFFRDAFNISITGLFEVTEVLMGILVFAGVPIITAKDGHVAVTLLDTFIKPKLRLLQKFIVSIICTFLLGLFAWVLWDAAETLSGYNEVTLFARIPLAPVCYFMAIMTALSIPIQLSMTFISDERLQELKSDKI